eukprot:TRINITY_DN1939_c0_g1_i1.p1 TRINITY_DN1939_c0_g1~~TRINITY_DN1939_c0_g1_i1.p1  ORF type:complete len:864 (-),score=193.98 TRINITY_DN1939_c0_g1_i1:24254-26764(-)
MMKSAPKAKKVPATHSKTRKLPEKENTVPRSSKKVPTKKPSFQDKLMQIKQSLTTPQPSKQAKSAIKIQRWYRRKLARKRAAKLNADKLEITRKAIPRQQFEYHDQDTSIKSFNLFAGTKVEAKKDLNEDIKDVLVEKSSNVESHNKKEMEIEQNYSNEEVANVERKDKNVTQLDEFLKKLAEDTKPSPTKPKVPEIQNSENIEEAVVVPKPKPEPISPSIPEQSPSIPKIEPLSEPHFEKLASYLDEIVQDPVKISEKPTVENPSSTKVSTESIELVEAYNTINALKKVLEEERLKHKLKEKEFSERESQNLLKQKKEFEGIIERHLSFIDQLVKDKKDLTEHIGSLKTKVKEEERKESKKIKEMEQNFAAELKKNKEAWMAAEKLRKEKWEKEKTQEIKINTTKALQPELVNIMQKHQKQMRELEEQLEIKGRREKENYTAEFENKMKELKDKHRNELEEALENAREEYDAKLKQQYERFDRDQENQKARLKLEHQTEIDRLEFQRKTEREKHEKELMEIKKLADSKIDATKEYYEGKMEEQTRKQKLDSKRKKEELNAENAAWREELERQKQTEVQKIAAELKRQMEQQRKQEVEMVIAKLGDESHEYKKALFREKDEKISEMEANCQAKIDELNKAVNEWTNKYNALSQTKDMLDESLKVLMRNMEGLQKAMAEKEAKCKQLQSQSEDVKSRLQGVDDEYKKMIEELDLENRKKTIDLEKEIARLSSELEIAKKRGEGEVASMKQKNTKELELIEERVKKALGKKDEIIKQLKDEISSLVEQVEKYKELLAKQRRELLSKQQAQQIIIMTVILVFLLKLNKTVIFTKQQQQI